MKIGEIFMELGVKIDTIQMQEVVSLLGKLNFNSVLAATGVDGLYNGLKHIMEVGQGLTEPMYQFNQETGLSAQKMQQWSEYAQKMGIKGEVVSDSLAGIQKKMAAMKFGDTSLLSGIYMLQQAGAKITEADLNDPFGFLNKATEGLQRIRPELRTYVAGLLGLNEQLLLLKSFKGADAMPTPTPEQVNAIRNYTSAWTVFGIMFKQVMTDIAAEYAPTFKGLADSLSSFFTKLHEDSPKLRTIVDALIGLGALASGPLGQLVYVLFMILTHLQDIGKAAKSAGEWIAHMFNKQEGLNRKARINAAVDSFVNSKLADISNFMHPNNALALANGGGSTTHQVTQHNAITIIAHNIEDIEHKFTAFMEKTIAKSFYQNSRNY